MGGLLFRPDQESGESPEVRLFTVAAVARAEHSKVKRALRHTPPRVKTAMARLRALMQGALSLLGGNRLPEISFVITVQDLKALGIPEMTQLIGRDISRLSVWDCVSLDLQRLSSEPLQFKRDLIEQ